MAWWARRARWARAATVKPGISAASGRTLTSDGVAVSECRSGTSVHPGWSSPGSDATTTDPADRRYQSVSPQAVAAIDVPSVTRKLNRPLPPPASMAVMVAARAVSIAAPAWSHSRTSAHRNAESTIASSESRVLAAGACAAAESGQPSSRPLWLNSHWSEANGAAACSPTAVPGVASRTAASTAADRVTRARSGSDGSPQIGCPRRYRAGTGSPSAYQPMPNPSALTVPCRCRRGAHACRYSPCGGSISTDRSVAEGPR